MKKTAITCWTLGLSLGLTSLAHADTFKAPEDLSKVKPQQLCMHYAEQDKAEQKRYFERLDTLGLLSHKDYDLIPQGKVEVGSSMCGMYMGKGKPLDEDGLQIRPLVYKVVHIYEDLYAVTQSGMVMETHQRIPGELPPSLNKQTPKVAPPPISPR